jgi:hypothetical protein
MKLKNLPIGVHEFPDFHSDNLLYIDKTEHIHHLVTKGKYYFLSRPRRFGKSLLLSTLKCLFQGRRELFQGLWIEDKWDWSVTYPVVHISFLSANILELGIEEGIQKMLEDEGKKHGIVLEESSNALLFKELIHKIYEKQGKVVILIDEYDKAIVDYLEDKPKAHEHRGVLKNFYEVLKNNQEYLHFVFLTGITKFSKVSLFSSLNHLLDISLNAQYNALVGYTQAELEHYFKDYLSISASKLKKTEKALLKHIKDWYNGYNWTGKDTLYNPFSILGFFNDSAFRNFWFSTGTPTFLAVMAREQTFYDLDNVPARQEAFDTFEIEDLDPQAVMFQTGYLTIKKFDAFRGNYTLGYPNREVRQAFLAYMVNAFAYMRVNKVSPMVIQMEQALMKKDLDKVMSVIDTMFANIPNSIFMKDVEKYYHSLMHLILNYLGTYIDSEVNTNDGRIDAVVQTSKYIYVFEFKLDATAEAALHQIHEKEYLLKYKHRKKELMAVGVNFSSETKRVQAWKMEKVPQ